MQDSTSYYFKIIHQPGSDKDLTNAYEYFDRLKSKNLGEKLSNEAVLNLMYIAEIQKKLGLIYESEKSVVQALELLNQLDEDEMILASKVAFYNQLGTLYSDQKNFLKALEYFDIALKISTDSTRTNSIRNNKAVLFDRQEKHDLAVQELTKVYNYNLSIKDKEKVARSLDNLGFARSHINDSLALPNMMEALSMREDINHISGILTSYYHLSKFFKERDPEKSQDFADKAYAIAVSTNNINQQEAALELKVGLKNDPDLAQYIYIKDSIADFQRRSRDQYAALKYDKESEIKRAEASQIKMERWIIFSIVLGLISILIYYFQRTKHTREKQQKVYETESRISKRIHDELANDVYGAIIQLENKSANVPLIINDLEAIYQNARDISQEKSIYNSTQEFIDDLKRMLSSFSNDQTNLIVRGLSETDWADVSGIKKVALFRVLKELLVNMKKHSQARIVSIVFKRHEKHLVIRYIDDGIGMASDQANKGSGLKNAESRIQAIGGKFIFDDTKIQGSKIEVNIPL